MPPRRRRSAKISDKTRIYPQGVRLTNIPLSTPTGLLQLYLRNPRKSGGGNISILDYHPNQHGTAFVIFEEDSVHWEFVRRRRHIINQVDVQAELVISLRTIAEEHGNASTLDLACSHHATSQTTLTDDEATHLICVKGRSLLSTLQTYGCSVIISPSPDSKCPWFCQLAGQSKDNEKIFQHIDELLCGIGVQDVDHFNESFSPSDCATARDSIDCLRQTGHKPDVSNECSLGPTLHGNDGSLHTELPNDFGTCTTSVTSVTCVDSVVTSTVASSSVCVSDTEKSLQSERTPVVSAVPTESEIQIYKSVVPFVLGQSGEAVANLELKNDVTIRIGPVPDDTSLAWCRVRGHFLDKVFAAKNAILSVNKTYNLQAGERLEDSESDQHHLSGDTSQWIKRPRGSMLIPTNVCGLVIGKEGGNIRKIKQISGASVRVPRDPSSSDWTACHIEGAKERIRLAAALVAEKAKLTTYPELPAKNLAALQCEDEPLSLEDCKLVPRYSSYNYSDLNALSLSGLSVHTSREALCCWIYLATGYFPSVLYFSHSGSKAIAILKKARDYEARATVFAAANPLENKTLRLKVVQRTSRVQLHGLPDGFNIADVIPTIGRQLYVNVAAVEYLLRNVPILLLERTQDVQMESRSFPLPGQDGKSLCVTPHFDELGILKPEQILSACDLGWTIFMRDCIKNTFTTPCLVISGLADEIDRRILESFLSNPTKSNGGTLRNLFLTENTAVVQFEDPHVTQSVHAKYEVEGINIGGLRLRAHLIEAPASWSSADKRVLRFKNVGAATVDSLKYVLQTACRSAVQDIRLIWTKSGDVEAIATFECELDIAQTCAWLSVITLDGCRLEAEFVAPCTSVLIQNVPLDVHSDLLELCLPPLPDDNASCRNVAAHTWLAQFRKSDSIQSILKSPITYKGVGLLVTENYQNFAIIQDARQLRGVRGTPRLKLDFLDSSLVNFVISARHDKFLQVISDHYGAVESSQDGLPVLYFKPMIRDIFYWQSFKKWCRLTDAILHICAHDLATHTISLVGPLAELLTDNSALPHFQAFTDVVAAQGNDLRLTVVKASENQGQCSDQTVNCLQMLGTQAAVHKARATLEQLLRSPCSSCVMSLHSPDELPNCPVVCHTERVKSSMHLRLLYELGFGEKEWSDASLGLARRCDSAGVSDVQTELLFEQNALSLQGCCIAIQRAYTDVLDIQRCAVSRKLLGSEEWARLMREYDAVRDYVYKRLRDAISGAFKDTHVRRAAVWAVSAHESAVTVMATDTETADLAQETVGAAVVDQLLSMSPSFFEAAETAAWRDFIVLVQNVFGSKVVLTVRKNTAQLQLTCLDKDHFSLQQDLKKFLRTHTVTSAFLAFPPVFVEYMITNRIRDLREIENQLIDKFVRIVCSPERDVEQSIDVGNDSKPVGFDIHGNEEGVEMAKAHLMRLRGEVVVKRQRLDVPGAGAFFASAANKLELLLDISNSTQTAMLITSEPADATAASAAANSDCLPEINEGEPRGSIALDSTFRKSSSSGTGTSRVVGMPLRGKACLVKGTYITVALGDITEENTTFIVNGTDCSLSLSGQVSSVLLRKGGSTIKDECSRRGPIDSSGILITSSGLLKCQSIMHVDASLDSERLVTNCLKKAVEYSAESIAFPAIGTGGYGKPANIVAQAMLDAAAKFIAETEPKHLKQIKFVIFDPSSLIVFEGALREACSRYQKSLKELMFWLLDKFKTSVKGIFAAPTYFFMEASQEHVAEGALAAAAKAVLAPVAAGLPERACKFIDLDGKLEEVMNSQSPADEITQAVRDAARELPKAKVVNCCICGTSVSQIDAALQQLNSRCSEILKANSKKITEPKEVISHLTAKQAESISLLGTWLDVQIDIDSGEHVLSMTSLDRESLSHTSDRLRDALLKQRRESLQVRTTPVTWSIVDGYAAPTLGLWTEEYVGIERELRRSLGSSSNQYCIISIARIENSILWQQYLAYKKKTRSTLSTSSSSLPIERRLWHGTAEEAIESICHHGFNRSYCGKNAVVYGQGVYFARDASYSASDTYSVPTSRGEKHLIYANVVTGEYEVGTSQTRVPNRKPNHTTAVFESTVDNVHSPSIFVTYNDTQAYPAYVVKVKRVAYNNFALY